ncbi:MAG TPA: hypothetical protein VIT92_07415 [Burkholderiaceae bacterium]
MTVRQLLPNEPSIPDSEWQHALTARFLIPALSELNAYCWDLRRRIDPVLIAAQPAKFGKAYPLGQCLEISQVAEGLMRQPGEAVTPGPPALGKAALSAFLQHGGALRQVWGDLRGQYFQNAFLLGTLYVDVSNDTVVATKPSVEILPFAQSNLTPVGDFRHFMRIGGSYWRAHFLPNHVLPELAPYFPLIAAIPDGTLRFEPNSHYMVALTAAAGFAPSADVLGDAPLDDALFAMLARRMQAAGLAMPANAEAGRKQALAHCARYGAEGRAFGDAQYELAAEALRKASAQLDAIRVTRQV